MILLELATGIILPGEGESWESLRLGDFSEMEESLSVLPKEMSNMIIWLLTAESTLRPNIDAVLESDQFSKRQVSDKGTLYEYYVQQQEEEQEEEQDIGASAMLFEQNQQDNDDDKCIAGQAIHSTPEAKVY
jgi:hypothetical protein